MSVVSIGNVWLHLFIQNSNDGNNKNWGET